MKFVDKAGAQILPDRGSTAAESHILAARRLPRAFKGGLDSVGHKVKNGPALHRDRGASMMSEYEDVAVIGWFIAPPSLPLIVRPRSAHRAEHIAAQYPGADILKAAGSEIIVRSGGAAFFAEKHLLKRPCRKNPLVQRHSVDSHRIVYILTRAGSEAVSGYAETADHELALRGFI